MSILGIKFMDELVGGVRNQKVSIGIIAGVLFLAWNSWQWAFETFSTKAEAAENVHKLESMLQSNNNLLQDHIDEYRIGEAIKDVESIEGDLWHLKMHESQAGETAETRALKAEMEKKLDHAIEYRNCLMNQRPNCKHLSGR
jgi:hypothetical protein